MARGPGTAGVSGSGTAGDFPKGYPPNAGDVTIRLIWFMRSIDA
jgi:hypothetical protein